MMALILFCITFALYWIWRHRNTKSKLEPPTYPGGLPLIGHAHLLMGDTVCLWNTIKEVSYTTLRLGGVITASIGPRSLYVVTNPEDSLTVANACLEKDVVYEFAKPWLGEGLLTGKVSIWKRHRMLLNPAFSQRVLDGFEGVFNSQSRRLVKDLEVKVGKGPFDHFVYMRRYALETICLTTMGVDLSKNSVLNNQYEQAMEQILNSLTERFQKFWLHNNFIYSWSTLKKKDDQSLKILHNMSDKVLQERKAAYLNNKKNGFEASSDTKFKAFLDLLLELSIETGAFNDSEIREEVNTMIAAGHDTTADVLMFTLVLIGSYPKVQERIVEETQNEEALNTNIISNGEELSLVDLSCKASTWPPYNKISSRLSSAAYAVIKEHSFREDEVLWLPAPKMDPIFEERRCPRIYCSATSGDIRLRNVLGDDDKDVTKQDLSRLLYLEAVLKESMRIYPIVPLTARRLDKNVKLMNYTLTAGRTCFTFIYGIHRHPMWGDDAEEFKPERWLDKTTLPSCPTAFAAFSIGRRVCIGKPFAFMSMKTTLAHVLRHYRIQADHTKMVVKADVVLKPVYGHHISIEKRT